MDEYMLERDILAKFEAHHDHAGNPEEDDIIARNERSRRIEMLKLLGLFRPAHRFKRPEA